MDKKEVKLLLGRPTVNLRIQWLRVRAAPGAHNNKLRVLPVHVYLQKGARFMFSQQTMECLIEPNGKVSPLQVPGVPKEINRNGITPRGKFF